MERAFYSEAIAKFLTSDEKFILGILADANKFALDTTQKDAWLDEIRILKNVLSDYKGSIYFEFSIPRMGRRIDVVLLIGAVVFVLEFKVVGLSLH